MRSIIGIIAVLGLTLVLGSSVSAQVAVEAGRGPLRQDPTYGHWFSFADGTFPYLVGTTNYDLIGTPDANIRATIDFQAQHFNVMRVSLRPKRDLWRDFGLSPTFNINDANAFGGTWASPTTGLNPTYWSRFHAMMDYAASKGMIVELILVRGFKDEEVGPLEDQATLEALIAETSKHWNLMYCIANEWQEHPDLDVGSMAKRIKAADPGRPLSVHGLQVDSQPHFAFFGESWVDYAIYQRSGGDDAQNALISSYWNQGVPQINEEYGYEGALSATSVIQVHWGIASAGGMGMYGHAPNGISDYHGWWMLGAGSGAPGKAHVQLGYMRDFMTQQVGFWKMSPNNARLSQGSGYVLENPGQEYLIVLPRGGSFTVSLSGVSGSLPVKYLDPVTGAIGSMEATAENASSYSGSAPAFRIVHIGARSDAPPPSRPRPPEDLVVE